MPYLTESCGEDPGQLDEIAEFLAKFVEDGEVSGSLEETFPATWRKRLDWWWTSNPFCRSGSPRGFLIRDDSGAIVGFYGFIPHDYVVDGQEIPSLIGTTSFVRRKSRDAALGLFLRAHRMRNDYQLIDGGPNAEAAELISKLGYSHCDRSKLLVYPVRRKKWNPRSWVFQAARVAVPSPNGRLSRGRLVSDLESVQEIPEISDGRMRKRISREGLNWYLNSGSEQKVFAGWCDEEGTLECYVVGIPWKKFGQETLVILDYAALTPSGEALLDEVVALLASEPERTGLPPETDIVIWPVAGGVRGTRPLYQMNYDSKLYFHLPKRWHHFDRVRLPFEGDRAFC